MRQGGGQAAPTGGWGPAGDGAPLVDLAPREGPIYEHRQPQVICSGLIGFERPSSSQNSEVSELPAAQLLHVLPSEEEATRPGGRAACSDRLLLGASARPTR
jgi:hypothetical protein